MKNTSIKTSILFFLCACFSLSCGQSVTKADHPIATTTIEDINNITTKLPQAPGYQAFTLNCLICHSASYIQNQPDLPEKTWTAIVTKMQKTFGAPVSDSSVKEIVQYLVAIKGKS